MPILSFYHILLLSVLAPSVLASDNPLSVKSATILGNQTSSNDAGTYRDGGWEGQIGSTYFQVYADTTRCSPTNAAVDCDLSTFRANTVALSTSNPQSVTDYSTSSPELFCDSPVDGYRLHLTNIVSLSSTTGVAWYANISSDTSTDIDGVPVGSGVATISYSGTGAPTCTVLPQFWGNTEPIWGDHGAIGGAVDGYIYILGAVGSDTPGANYSDVFVARVAPGSHTDISQYQYWDGTDYSSTRLTYPIYLGYAPASAIRGPPQGSITYNSYYNTYVYLYPGPALSGEILAVTSQFPQGPYTSEVTVYTGNTILYAPVMQPHFDTSGKTLIFDVAIFSPIYLQTIQVIFN